MPPAFAVAPRLCPDTELYLKTENLQVTGSFKVRGAYYKISQLTEEERAKGVIACSAGNHAQGVALAATRMGIKSVVCMPDGAPIMKVESTKRLGAEVELVKGTYDDAHDRAVELQEETGMTFIHPYDDEQVIAGQGSIGLEILEQLPDVEAVIVPIGGGGLGSMALMLGYQRRMYIIMYVSVLVLVILVQIFQSIGTHLAVRMDKRLTKESRGAGRRSAKQKVKSEKRIPGAM